MGHDQIRNPMVKMEGDGSNNAEIGDPDRNKKWIKAEAQIQKQSERLKKVVEQRLLQGIGYLVIVLGVIPTCLQAVVTSSAACLLLRGSEPILFIAILFIILAIIFCLEFVSAGRTLLEEFQRETDELTKDGVEFKKVILGRISFLESCHKKYRNVILLELAALEFILCGLVSILLFPLRKTLIWAVLLGLVLLPLLFNPIKLATKVCTEYKMGVDKCNKVKGTLDLCTEYKMGVDKCNKVKGTLDLDPRNTHPHDTGVVYVENV